jgi:hypothetical protein
MSRDGLLPKVFSNVHPVFRTPAFSTVVAGIVVAIPSGLFDIGTLADLSNIGTLFAFVLVSVGVIVLRYREPERRRGFRVPFGPVIPVLSVIFCFLLMAGLPIITWFRFIIWLVIGLVIFFSFGYFRSEFAKPLVPLAIPWWVILLLFILTLGLFPMVLFFIQAGFAHTLDRRKGPAALGFLSLVLFIASIILAFYFPAFSRPISLAAAILYMTGIFMLRQSLLSYYSKVEPIGLELSGVMTFLFGPLYLQYHLSRIAKWKKTGAQPAH